MNEYTIEIARSFSFKRNLGGYESQDFFASRNKSVVCKNKEEEMRASEEIFNDCVREVMDSVIKFDKMWVAVKEKSQNDRSKQIELFRQELDEVEIDVGN